MKPIDPAELSGLLDGELSAQRAEEVRQAMEADPQLRASYSLLQTLDGALMRCSDAARFEPRRPLLEPQSRLSGWLAALAVLLIAIRIASRLTSPWIGNVLEAAALAAVVLWLLVRLYRNSDQDCWTELLRLATPAV